MLHFLRSFFFRKMFPEKILNRNPYKSYILDIMDQKSTLCDEPILNNDDPLKKQRYFFFSFSWFWLIFNLYWWRLSTKRFFYNMWFRRYEHLVFSWSRNSWNVHSSWVYSDVNRIQYKYKYRNGTTKDGAFGSIILTLYWIHPSWISFEGLSYKNSESH